MDKSPDAFRTISEVAEYLETPAHVLRFWESRFPQIKPVKRAGGRRYYRPADVALLSGIKRLLHDDGMTIRGVQKILREQGIRHVAGLADADGQVDETAFPSIEALDEVLSPTVAAPVSAEIVPFAPRSTDHPADAAAPAADEAPFIDTDAEPAWQVAESAAEILIGAEEDLPEADLAAPDPLIAELVAESQRVAEDQVAEMPLPPLVEAAPTPASPPFAPAPDTPPTDLWAAAGVAAPPPVAPPLAARKAAPSLPEDLLPEPDLRAPLAVAVRLRGLSPDQTEDNQTELSLLRDRLLALREQIAAAAHVRSR